MEMNNSNDLVEINEMEYRDGVYSTVGLSVNMSGIVENLQHDLPMYLRIIVCVFIIIILIVGTIGNTMIALVISCSRDMRTSTNIFLLNLSVADLLVLILVTPTALLEVIHHPEIWMLGPTLCKLVPVLEVTVCHASVLTILAISFERYYAICSPLKANYVCTKARAVYICIIVWILACIITSPMFLMVHYIEPLNANNVPEPYCFVGAGSFWPDLYTLTSMAVFFFVPFIMLVITYGIIARKLTQDRSALNAKNENNRGRKQVVLMLGTVVFTFFLCLLPFRILTLAVLLTDIGGVLQKHTHTYYTLLYLARIMSYINSAVNPILYNVMSSKFRNGFLRLCGRRKKQYIFHRNGTFLTLTTTNSNQLSLGINNNNGHGPLNPTYSTSPSTSPDLLTNPNTAVTAGLIRKNGIRKGSHPRLMDGSRLSRRGNGKKYGGGLVELNRCKNQIKKNKNLTTHETTKILNPRCLSKKFIYSYVSGHGRSESML